MRNINVNKIAVENVYLFTGTEEVRGNAKIDQIIQTIAPATFSVTKYDLDISPLSEVIIDAITVPFLVDYKVIIVKNPYFITKKKQGRAQDLNNMIKYLKNPSDQTVLIINAIGLEPDPTNEIYQLLQKVAYIKDTQLLDEVEYKGWVIRLFRDESVTIKDDALELMVELVKQNYVRMEQEVKKLATFVGAGGTHHFERCAKFGQPRFGRRNLQFHQGNRYERYQKGYRTSPSFHQFDPGRDGNYRDDWPDFSRFAHDAETAKVRI